MSLRSFGRVLGARQRVDEQDMTFATNSTDGGKLGYGSRGNDAASSAHGLTVQIRLLAGLLVLSLGRLKARIKSPRRTRDILLVPP